MVEMVELELPTVLPGLQLLMPQAAGEEPIRLEREARLQQAAGEMAARGIMQAHRMEPLTQAVEQVVLETTKAALLQTQQAKAEAQVL
jgi:hypothetical protein